MDVLTSETCWALNNEIIKQVTPSWSLFIQLVKCNVGQTGQYMKVQGFRGKFKRENKPTHFLRAFQKPGKWLKRWRYCKQSKCTWMRYHVSGRAELRLAASRPCRLQLCAAHKQSGHSLVLTLQWLIAEAAVLYVKVISWWKRNEQHCVCLIPELAFETESLCMRKRRPNWYKMFSGKVGRNWGARDSRTIFKL